MLILLCICMVITCLFYYYHPSQLELSQSVIEITSTSHILNVENILQNPELPTGCEVTSLAIVLHYLGYSIDKCELADQYLLKGEAGVTDFHEAFVGHPRSSHAYGCYHEVIFQCAQDYLSTFHYVHHVLDVTGTAFEDLYTYIDQGIPVIVWTTIQLLEPYYTTSWVINGKNIRWIANEHCVVVIGYDMEKQRVYVSDPLKGNVDYDANLFKKRYEQLFSQALIVY